MSGEQDQVRQADPNESERLTELAIASKAYWGYDADFMARAAAVLQVSPEYIRRHDVWILEKHGDIAGFYALIDDGDVAVLDHLWLAPNAIGKGSGRLLFEHAVTRARELKARRLEWEAEPNAAGFYRRMGARPVRETTSSLGRTLEVYALDLSQAFSR